MKIFTWLSIWILTMTCSVASISAESNVHRDVIYVNPSLSLSEVLNEAIKHQPQQAKVQSLKYSVEAKRSLANSTLPQAPAITIYHQTDVIGSGRNQRGFQATLYLPLWLPHQREARAKLANASWQKPLEQRCLRLCVRPTLSSREAWGPTW